MLFGVFILHAKTTDRGNYNWVSDRIKAKKVILEQNIISPILFLPAPKPTGHRRVRVVVVGRGGLL